MQITANSTPYLAESFESTDKTARKHCVVVVKATFDIDRSGECREAERQTPFVYADVHHGEPGLSSAIWESDFAPVKPRVDVLLCANAMTPAGRKATALEVIFAGPGFTKTARVTGDRTWVKGVVGLQPSEPHPFTTLPLIWDRAFGGADQTHAEISQHKSELRNLAGTGFRVNGDRNAIIDSPLPNIEHPDQLVQSWSDKPEPIGFCPVGRAWQPRMKHAGTYDERWLKEKRPFLPDDFDDLYFQAAPRDQQLAQLAPGDAFHCLNMTEEGRFTARMPGWNVPVRFFFEKGVESALVAPDTVILIPNSRRLILLGRARVPVPRKFTALREIQIGRPERKTSASKPHYPNLAEAVAASRKRN